MDPPAPLMPAISGSSAPVGRLQQLPVWSPQQRVPPVSFGSSVAAHGRSDRQPCDFPLGSTSSAAAVAVAVVAAALRVAARRRPPGQRRCAAASVVRRATRGGNNGRRGSRPRKEENEGYEGLNGFGEDETWGDFKVGPVPIYGGPDVAREEDEEDEDEDEEDWPSDLFEDGEEDLGEDRRNQALPQDEFGEDAEDEDEDGWEAEFDFEDRDRGPIIGSSNAFDGLEDIMDDDLDDDSDYHVDASSSSAQARNVDHRHHDVDDEESLLYDDFEVTGDKLVEMEQASSKLAASQERKAEMEDRRGRRKLETLEERVYKVEAEGIAVRTLPDERSPRTGEILRQGEEFTAIEAVDGEGKDPRLYLRLPEGRGWVFDDEKIYPGMPSVKLVSVAGQSMIEEVPPARPRPLIAVIGRPNVGKSSLVNRICDCADIHGAITFDEEGVTRDRTYKLGEHTDDFGDTFLFEVIDTGGLIFHDDPEAVTFRNEIKLQIDVALREAVACIFVVDSRIGLAGEDKDIANYIRRFVNRGLKVVVAVAKCDRLETMDQHAAEFWALDLGEPFPVCSLHGRGVWEVMDKLINKGCDGLFPMRIKGVDDPATPRDNAVSVAICGKPNAGKSSLLNALVGETRSIVSDLPGTTTDSVDAYLETDDGRMYCFVDTAGVRRKGRIKPGTEWLSVNRAMKAVQRADVCLLVLDASEIRTGDMAKGFAYWSPDNQERYLARAIEERGTACVIVLSKWDAVANKDERTQTEFIQAVRSNLAGVGQWAEIVTCSSLTGQRLTKILKAVEKTLEAHKKRVSTHVLNEVVRDALLWRLPAARAYDKKQGRIYYAVQTSTEPPTIALFVNSPKLFGPNYKTYIENKLRQDLNWFGTPLQLDWRKRSERRAVSQAEQWLTPRLQPEQVWR